MNKINMHEAVDHARRRFFGAASRQSSRHYPLSQCPPSRWTVRPMASFLPPMAGLLRPSSQAGESTIGCRMRVTPCRSKYQRSSPTRSWK
jgi:hypothetical protein